MAKKAGSSLVSAPKKPARRRVARKAIGQGTSKARTKTQGKVKSPSGGDAVRKLLESPFVADLLAIGATAALAEIARHGFAKGKDKGTSKALKQAGKAAATAMGQRLKTEFKEIRKASKTKSDAK